MKERRAHPRAKFSDGEMILAEGSSGAEMYVVYSGKVRIFRRQDGKDTTMATLNKGEFFGEMSVFDKRPRSASAQAVGDVDLTIFTEKDLKAVVGSSVVWDMLVKMSRRIREVDDAVAKLSADNIARIEGLSGIMARRDQFL